MKATIWSSMVPSHTPQHRTEKRTQNTNWKTVHMLDSTIWWKTEYSHPLEKKKKCCRLLILKSFHHTVSRIPIIFVQLCGSTLYWNTLPSLPPLQEESSHSSKIAPSPPLFFKVFIYSPFSTSFFECDTSQSRRKSVWCLIFFFCFGNNYFLNCIKLYPFFWYRHIYLYEIFMVMCKIYIYYVFVQA